MSALANPRTPTDQEPEERRPVALRFPGRWVGGVALVAGPALLLAGVLLRLPTPFFYPHQLAAYGRDPGRMDVAYSLFALGNVLLWPAVLVLVQMIGGRCPRWALWGGTLTLCGLFARTFSAGVDHFAFQLVRVQGLVPATRAVADSYAAFHVFLVIALAKIPGWLMLAAGAYRSGALPPWRAAALALMAALMGGTLKGSTLMSVIATLGLCVALLPLGVQVLRATDAEQPAGMGEPGRPGTPA